MKTLETEELEKALVRTYFKFGSHIAFEVNLANATSLMMRHNKTEANDFDEVYPGIADAMVVDNYLNFTCFELKVTKSDFHSDAKLSFIGNKNYYVMPLKLFESVKDEVPKNIGVLVPSREVLRCAKPARWAEMKFDKSYVLLSMMTSAHNHTTLSTIESVFPHMFKKAERPQKPDAKKYKFARLEDGTIEPLYYSNGEPRHFYKDEDGKWRMDFDRYAGAMQMYMSELITEFLEEKE